MRRVQHSLSYVEEYILIVLKCKEMYGLEILNALKLGSEGRLKISEGTLYPTLRKLKTKGFVEARWGDEGPEELEGARRRYYKISPQGAEVLHELQQMRAGLKMWKPV